MNKNQVKFAIYPLGSNFLSQEQVKKVANIINLALFNLDYNCITIDNIVDDRRYIFIGANFTNELIENIPNNSIIYNIEPIIDRQRENISYLIPLLQQHTIWDYSEKNCIELALMGCGPALYVPLGYTSQLSEIEIEEEKNIDVVIFSKDYDRGNKILEGLKKFDINVAQVNELDREILRKSKIVLNIGYEYDLDISEINHLNYLLANNLFVLSEQSINKSRYIDKIQDAVVFSPYSNLIEQCLYFLNQPEKCQQIASKGFEIITDFSETSILEETLIHSQNHPDKLVRIDLGCGTRKFPGFLGVDIFSDPNVDIVADLSSGFPFKDSSVDFIRAYDFIEHLPDRILTMNEIWRIGKHGAIVNLLVPSSDGRGAFQDPTHVSFWNLNSFRYFTIEYPWFLELCQQYGFKGAFSLLALRQYEGEDKVIHVHALLKVVKDQTVKIPEKSIFAVIFPDWQQQDEILWNDLKAILTRLTNHPDHNSIVLIIDISSFSSDIDTSPQEIVWEVAMDLLMNEDIDIESSGIEIAFVNCLDSQLWQMIKLKLGYHIAMTNEWTTVKLIENIFTIQTYSIDDFPQKSLTLRFGLNQTSFSWLKEQITDKRITVGEYTYSDGTIDWQIYNPEEQIVIGKFCFIAKNVKIFGGAEHDGNRVSTYPFKSIFFQEDLLMVRNPDARTKDITLIGHDVWIGHNATILSRVNIGNGAIIEPETVVSQDIPPYAIVAGNPASIIRYRFSSEAIEFLLKLEWWNWPLDQILANLDNLSQNPEEWMKKFQ